MDYLPSKRLVKEEGPLITEGIVGFRVFRIGFEKKHNQQSSPVLRSLAVDSFWEPGLNQAVCKSSGAKAPEDNCHCGFNAYYHLGEKFLVNEDFFSQFAIAAVLGGGEVRMHRDGFRAEKAVIIGFLYNQLMSGPKEAEIQNQLANKYQVPIYLNREDLIKKSRESGLIINSAEEVVDLERFDWPFKSYQQYNLGPQLALEHEIKGMGYYAPINFYYEFLNENKKQNNLIKSDLLIKNRGVEIIKDELGSKANLIKILSQKNRGPITLATVTSLVILLAALSLLNPDTKFINLLTLFMTLLILPIVFVFVLEKSEQFLRNQVIKTIKDKLYI